MIREKRAPHLLDIDGDVCHHIHIACKAVCSPFDKWAEGLFRYSEIHWSQANRDFLGLFLKQETFSQLKVDKLKKSKLLSSENLENVHSGMFVGTTASR